MIVLKVEDIVQRRIRHAEGQTGTDGEFGSIYERNGNVLHRIIGRDAISRLALDSFEGMNMFSHLHMVELHSNSIKRNLIPLQHT